jgi:hypothetical protein
MKFPLPVLLSVLVLASIARGEGVPVPSTNIPPDPFGHLPAEAAAPTYGREVDRSRGTFSLPATDGTYQAGSHFANWSWNMNLERWGHYYVGLLYESSRSKLGVQIKVGDTEALKSYAPRTSTRAPDEPLILGTAYLEKKGAYPVMLLTGDESNSPGFQVKGIHFSPAPESEPMGQSIDGSIELLAKSATAYAKMMRYEPKPEKNCLGFWTDAEDWVEWVFDVTTPGTFSVDLTYGCGSGSEGSRVAILIDDQSHEFVVEDTGGFQSWKSVTIGQAKLELIGEHRLAVVVLEKKGNAVMDVQRIVLTPTP